MRRDFKNSLEISDLIFQENIPAWHFYDNQKDADECAELVLKGKKRATAPSLWELEIQGEKIPNIGKLNIVTNWDGAAKCVIRTTKVEILPFSKVTAKHAELEGEGDCSLEYWRKVHLEYYQRILAGSPYKVSEDMPIVFEQFEVLFPTASKRN